MNENGTILWIPPGHAAFVYPVPANEPDPEE